MDATSAPQDLTLLLRAWSGGDEAALAKIMPLVYSELMKMAQRYMRRQNPGHTLQTTALIHEAYLKLIAQKDPQWQNRTHFFAVAATAMRQILVDYARAKYAAKRRGEVILVPLDQAEIRCDEQAAMLVLLDEAMVKLTEIDKRKSQVVELKYFGGLTVGEIAEVLHVSPDTVARDWRLARTWLFRQLSSSGASDGT